MTGFTTYEERGFDLYKLHSLLWFSLKRDPSGILSVGLNKERVVSALVLQAIYFKNMKQKEFLEVTNPGLNLGQIMVSAWATAIGSELPSALQFYTENKETVESYILALDTGAKQAEEIINGNASTNSES